MREWGRCLPSDRFVGHNNRGGIYIYDGLQARARVCGGVRNIVGGDGEGCFPGRRAARKTAGEDCYSPSGKDMLKTSVEKALAPPGA